MGVSPKAIWLSGAHLVGEAGADLFQVGDILFALVVAVGPVEGVEMPVLKIERGFYENAALHVYALALVLGGGQEELPERHVAGVQVDGAKPGRAVLLGDFEFDVPAKLKKLILDKDFGQYLDKDGTMHVCFLSNNDITGGNSGSPIMNANGELIGLAFDGNWEALSSDIVFNTELQRCINVDVRYVLFIIDKFGGAGYLLKEMDVRK